MLITIATMIMTSKRWTARARSAAAVAAWRARPWRTHLRGWISPDQLDVVGSLPGTRPRLHLCYGRMWSFAPRPGSPPGLALGSGAAADGRSAARPRHRPPSGAPPQAPPPLLPTSSAAVLRSLLYRNRALDRELLVVRPPLSPRWGTARLAGPKGASGRATAHNVGPPGGRAATNRAAAPKRNNTAAPRMAPCFLGTDMNTNSTTRIDVCVRRDPQPELGHPTGEYTPLAFAAKEATRWGDGWSVIGL